jgi:hypothetical protein
VTIIKRFSYVGNANVGHSDDISVFDNRDRRTIAAKILWSSLFDTSNVNQVLMSIYMTISNYSCQKYGTFSF